MSNGFWFKHDYNASNDRKIQVLDIEYPGYGYSLYMKALEQMGLNNGFLEEIDIKILAQKYGYDFELTKEIFNYFFEINLFTKADDKILSERFKEQYDELEARCKANRKNGKKGGRPKKKTKEKANENPSKNPNKTQLVSGKKPDKIREDKDKSRIEESKEDKDKIINKSTLEIIDYINSLDSFKKAKHDLQLKHFNELLDNNYYKEDIINICETINEKNTKVTNSILTIKNWLKQKEDPEWDKLDAKYPKEKKYKRFEAKIYFSKLSKKHRFLALEFVKDFIRNHEGEIKYLPNLFDYLDKRLYLDMIEIFKKEMRQVKSKDAIAYEHYKKRMERVNEYL